jgi:hypothetical protein
MEITPKNEILWTKIALKNLKKVHKFYIKIANKDFADQIINEIFEAIKSLEYSIYIGQE